MWYIQYIHNGVLVSNKKEGNPAICSNMDGSTVSETTQTRKTNTIWYNTQNLKNQNSKKQRVEY